MVLNTVNYRTIISFLAGPKVQQQWGKPVSKWVPITMGEPGRSAVWNDNFPIETHRLQKYTIDAEEHPEFFENFYGCWGNGVGNDGLRRLKTYNMVPHLVYQQFYDAASKSIMFIERDSVLDAPLIFDFINQHGEELGFDEDYNYEKPFVKKAFLAPKKLQEQWSKPHSDWVLAGDGAIGWTDEFMKANHLKGRHDKYSPDRTLDITDGTTLSRNSWGCNSAQKLYYYSDDKKLMFMIKKKLIDKHGPDAYFDFIDSVNVDMGSGISGYIIIPEELKLL